MRLFPVRCLVVSAACLLFPGPRVTAQIPEPPVPGEQTEPSKESPPLAALAYAGWHQVFNREGAAGFFIVGMSLLGAIVSGIAGLIVARTVAAGAKPGFGKAVAFSSGSVLAIGALMVLVCMAIGASAPRSYPGCIFGVLLGGR